MKGRHTYRLRVDWIGNDGQGTASYRSYRRDHVVSADGKAPISGSSDASFRGDAGRWNPEELLVAALAQCHMLWYLNLAAAAGVIVEEYCDDPEGVMIEDATGGGGQFERVTLHPQVSVRSTDMLARAQSLHAEVPALCFIARSVNFPVEHRTTVVSTDRRGPHCDTNVSPILHPDRR